jgi:hypothetical protein
MRSLGRGNWCSRRLPTNRGLEARSHRDRPASDRRGRRKSEQAIYGCRSSYSADWVDIQKAIFGKPKDSLPGTELCSRINLDASRKPFDNLLGLIMEPQSHRTAAQAAADTLEILRLAPNTSDEDVVDALIIKGYAKLDATKLCLFVPSAFAWATLKLMGVESFPSVYIRVDEEERESEVPVSDEHYFTAALHVAVDVTQQGWTSQIDRPFFEAVISRSAEMDAANKALNSGEAIIGATLRPSRFHLPTQTE